jgi:hypothetical protein
VNEHCFRRQVFVSLTASGCPSIRLSGKCHQPLLIPSSSQAIMTMDRQDCETYRLQRPNPKTPVVRDCRHSGCPWSSKSQKKTGSKRSQDVSTIGVTLLNLSYIQDKTASKRGTLFSASVSSSEFGGGSAVDWRLERRGTTGVETAIPFIDHFDRVQRIILKWNLQSLHYCPNLVMTN